MADPSKRDDVGDSDVPSPDAELVFVYGSLKRGMANHQQMQGAVFAGQAVLKGLTLHDLGPFPMAIASGDANDHISGELYRINPKMLRELDRFEGVPRLYARHSWSLDDRRWVWVYVGQPHQVRFVSRLADGNWRHPSRVSQRDQPASPGRQNQSQR